jgi:molecular chaperone HscB
MDYFELYGLPVTFNPDMKLVKQKFYELSKKYHPDFYINEPSEKQEEVLNLSTLNNKAYQTLSDVQKRLPYVLELKGELLEGENYALPQDFLMEMMDVNEALMDLQFEPNLARLDAIKKEVEGIEAQMQQELDQLTERFDQPGADQQSVLASIKDLYYRRKYLRRIGDSIVKLESK